MQHYKPRRAYGKESCSETLCKMDWSTGTIWNWLWSRSFLFKKWSKLWAQEQPKNVPPAPLASNAAGSRIAVSNDNYVRLLYLSDSEVTVASNLSSVCLWFFPAWFWTQPKFRFSSEVKKIDRPSWFSNTGWLNRVQVLYNLISGSSISRIYVFSAVLCVRFH